MRGQTPHVARYERFTGPAAWNQYTAQTVACCAVWCLECVLQRDAVVGVQMLRLQVLAPL